MILYMLKSVSFPLNHSQLSDFFIDKYLNYFKFQDILAELIDNRLVEKYTTKTTVCYKATQDGEEALNAFKDDILPNHKKDLDEYIKLNKFKLKEESIIHVNYTESENGMYKATLEINENKEENFKIEIDAPTADTAMTLCENWKSKAKTIYTYVLKQLL